jgi:hypothetical protein
VVHSRNALLPALLIGLVPAACGSADPPPHVAHDIAAIRAGVDPRDEARAVAEGLERAGFAIEARLEHDEVVALGAKHDNGRTAIRIVTARGIAAALDAEDPERGLALLVYDERSDPDLDGDGRPEIAVATLDPELGRACIALARVGPDGTVLAVPIELGRLGEEACVESVEDVGGDARPELIAVAHDVALSRGVIPSVRVPLAVRGRGYAPAPPATFGAFWEAERNAREERLAGARAARDLEGVYHLAVELAGLERERGAPVSAQLRAFDAAFRGLVLTEGVARSVADTRAVIVAGWNRDVESRRATP